MQAYLDIVQNTVDYGKRKENRTGIDTFAVPNQHFSHDMKNGFPLLTTKKMGWKAVRVELEGFIGGITDKRWYQEHGCKIWNEWANPVAVRDRIEKEHGGIPYKPSSIVKFLKVSPLNLEIPFFDTSQIEPSLLIVNARIKLFIKPSLSPYFVAFPLFIFIIRELNLLSHQLMRLGMYYSLTISF